MKRSLTRKIWVRWIRPHISDKLKRQRIKLVWFVWGYYPLLTLNLPIFSRVSLLRRFLRVDWNIYHGHLPSEIAIICTALADRPAKTDEIMLEAGCFNGGSSAKFSIICRMLGYELYVFDSFQGVEPMSAKAKENTYDFSGEFAVPEERVCANITKYGEIGVCSFFKGWFADTLAHGVSRPVRIAYIDCDTAKGTREVLSGVMPALAHDGLVFSQDFHILPVRSMLNDPETWKCFSASPVLVAYNDALVAMTFPRGIH